MSLEEILNELNPPDDKCPYLCTINIGLLFSKVLPDNSIKEKKISNEQLEQSGISENATFSIFGFDLDDCIQKTKKILEQLHYDN